MSEFPAIFFTYIIKYFYIHDPHILEFFSLFLAPLAFGDIFIHFAIGAKTIEFHAWEGKIYKNEKCMGFIYEFFKIKFPSSHPQQLQPTVRFRFRIQSGERRGGKVTKG